jgi:hypothetical protein
MSFPQRDFTSLEDEARGYIRRLKARTRDFVESQQHSTFPTREEIEVGRQPGDPFRGLSALRLWILSIHRVIAAVNAELHPRAGTLLRIRLLGNPKSSEIGYRNCSRATGLLPEECKLIYRAAVPLFLAHIYARQIDLDHKTLPGLDQNVA